MSVDRQEQTLAANGGRERSDRNGSGSMTEQLGRNPLRAFIQGECCNTQPGDECLFSIRGSYVCLVLARSRRCRYFEESVLPLLTRCSNARCLKLYPDAADAYRRLFAGFRTGEIEDETEIRPCPSCGSPLPPRKRFCDGCARKRRREAYKRADAKRRGLCQQLTEKSASIS